MSYRERLRENIQLTSPEGKVFTPRWIGDPRSKPKKIGVFDFPGVDGSIVQDLGTSSTAYTLTLIFEGPDNDLESDRFFKALSERGVWEVIHPVHGLKKLQPLSFAMNDQPISSGNVTTVDTEWIEPLDPSAIPPSAPEAQSNVATQAETVNETATNQLEQSAFQAIAADIAEFRDAVSNVVSNVESFLQGISAISATITSAIEAIKRDINAVLEVVPLDVIAVAGQLQQLIQLPARAIQDVQTRLDAYGNFIDGISFSLTPEAPGTPAYNRVAIQELALIAAMTSITEISSTGDLLSRAEAVEVIETNLDRYMGIIDTLDATQELFEDQSIDKQYFSQSQTHGVTSILVALTITYLLRSIFDLKTEKRFTLDRDRNPVMVTIEEYGDLGENDSNLDLFLDSNLIQGDEYLIMPRGREIVVYV